MLQVNRINESEWFYADKKCLIPTVISSVAILMASSVGNLVKHEFIHFKTCTVALQLPSLFLLLALMVVEKVSTASRLLGQLGGKRIGCGSMLSLDQMFHMHMCSFNS